LLKPTISASAHRTHVVNRETALQAQGALREITANSGALQQPFMP
jgi:hypothetical protein